jgi:hypothetical protein
MNQLRNGEKTSGLQTREEAKLTPDVLAEVELLRTENGQLRSLCVELEQALQEATQDANVDVDSRLRDYEAMLEEKSEMIRQLHQQLQQAQSLVADLELKLASGPGQPTYNGPAPREEELLALSEELERERRQLQEDEQALMEQMKDMEIAMARERAEMARQRNDMQRLQQELQYELERLERNGAAQQKVDALKHKLHDATTRRGMAGNAPRPAQQQNQQEGEAEAEDTSSSSKKDSSFISRLFGGR